MVAISSLDNTFKMSIIHNLKPGWLCGHVGRLEPNEILVKKGRIIYNIESLEKCGLFSVT